MRLRYVRPTRNFRLPADAVKTYQVLAPENSHWRSATCDEVGCQDYLHGWRVRVETLTEKQLYAVTHSGRKFAQENVADGITYLVFEVGQTCFKAREHMLPVGKPGLYVVRDGDPWRGNPRGTPPRLHARAEDWVEDFAEHQQKLHERWKKG